MKITLDKAIQLLTNATNDIAPVDPEDLLLSIKLGLEALSHLRVYRKAYFPMLQDLLPSEEGPPPPLFIKKLPTQEAP